MRGRTALAGAVVTGLMLVLGFATPAHAADITTEEMTCDWIGNHFETEFDLRLTATATYENDWAAGVRRWKFLEYRLTHAGGSEFLGNKSNVNIRLTEYPGTPSRHVAFSYKSADNRQWDRQYIVSLVTNPPTTRIVTPSGAQDHSRKDLISFEAIFDLSGGGPPGLVDQTCTAWVKVGG